MSEKRELEGTAVPGGKRSVVQLTQRPASAETEEKGFNEALLPCQVQKLLGASTESLETVNNGDCFKQQFLNDRKRLLEIFPEELWLLVFGKLEHDSQLERVSNASLFFREILSSQKHNFLFNRVWEIMESGYKNHAEENAAVRLAEMLKLRLVCRSWCNTVSNLCQIHPIHSEMNPEKINVSDRRLFRKLTLRLTRWTESFRHFLPHFRSTHQTVGKNPFVGRSLHLRLEGDDNDEFKASVQNILETYGSHIWYCELRFLGMCQPIPTVTTVYSRIREVLCLMPNLKVLDLTVGRYQEDVEQEDEEQEDVEDEVWEQEDLESAITLNPLPRLRQLQMIRCVGLPTPMFQELVSRNNHITALDFNQKANSSEGHVPLMENLRSLAVTFASAEHIERLFPVTLPLTKLYLRLGCQSVWYWTLDWEKLYRALESKFKNTLTFLHINLPAEFCIPPKHYACEFAVDLPQLKNVELKLAYLTSLDMLLPLADTLTNLIVSMKVPSAVLSHSVAPEFWETFEEEARIKFLACARRGQPMESNIWSIFSKLVRVHFEYHENT